MTDQPGRKALRIGTPAAILAIVPYLLGFAPEKSLVVVGAKEPNGRISITFRFDLPDPPSAWAADGIAAHAAAIFTGQQVSTVMAIGYGPGSLVTPVVGAIRQALGPMLYDVLRVEEGRYWSYLCRESACCPAEGVPFSATHPVAEAMAMAGAQVLPDRAALAASIAPLGGNVRQSMRQATARAEAHAMDLFTSASRAARPGEARRFVVAEGLSAVGDAITTYRRGGHFVTDEQTAWLSLVLTSLPVRDDAWARMDEAHRDAHRRLWTDLVRRAEPAYVPAPASLLAFTAWQSGNGALANVALDRALEADPGYSMALLLRDVIDAGAPPSMARLPIAPEEVAASYAETADETPPYTAPGEEQ